MAGHALWLLSWNLRNGLVPPDRSLRDTLWRRRGPAACTDKEHLITGMLLKLLGGGQPRSFPSRHARPQTPKPMKSKSSTRIHDCRKNSGILASAMTQSGALGKR